MRLLVKPYTKPPTKVAVILMAAILIVLLAACAQIQDLTQPAESATVDTDEIVAELMEVLKYR